MIGYEYDEAYDEAFDEAYDEGWDESDLESAFEDLEFDEARRKRRRRRRPRGRRGRRVPVPAARPAGSSANLQRDRQLAKAVNVVNEDVGDVAARQAKASADLRTLKSALMFSSLIPPRPTIATARLSVNDQHQIVSTPNPTGAPAAGQVDVITSVTTSTNLTQALLPMMLTRNVGGPPGKGGGGMGNDMMLPLMLILTQQPQTTTAGQPAAQPGGMDTTMLMLVMMMSGAMS
ncbi:MAG TPA: hypothetical protein VGB15_15970 [Longimicrobium sp.]